MASSRVLVQEGIYDEMAKKLVEKAKQWPVGDPFDPQVRQGPQVSSDFSYPTEKYHSSSAKSRN